MKAWQRVRLGVLTLTAPAAAAELRERWEAEEREGEREAWRWWFWRMLQAVAPINYRGGRDGEPSAEEINRQSAAAQARIDRALAQRRSRTYWAEPDSSRPLGLGVAGGTRFLRRDEVEALRSQRRREAWAALEYDWRYPGRTRPPWWRR